MPTHTCFLLLSFASCTYAAECTADEFDASTVPSVTDCTDDGGKYDCENEECPKQLESLANFDFPECTINGLSGKVFFVDGTLNAYNTACDANAGSGEVSNTNKDGSPSDSKENDNSNPGSSDAHGYSTAHYMIAMLVPMALLGL